MLEKLTVGVGFSVYLDENSSLQPASIYVYKFSAEQVKWMEFCVEM